MANGGSARMVALDGLRGIAALGVYAYHIRAFGRIEATSRGYLMVDLFFVLSGFVLTRVYDRKLADGLGAGMFMVARLLRLWPVMALGALIGLGCAAAEMGATTGINLHGLRILAQLMLCALILLPYPGSHPSGGLFPLNGTHWSLLFELAANLVHGLLLWRLRTPWLVALTLAFAAVMILSGYIAGSNRSGPFFATWYHAIGRIGFGYCAGMLMARRWSADGGRWRLPWLPALALPFVLTALLPYLPLAEWIGDAAIVLVAYPVCLWFAVSSTPPGWAARAMTWLGMLSYPLYALHGPIVMAAKKVSLSPLALVVTTVLCIGLAALTAILLERGPWPRMRHALVDALARKRALRAGAGPEGPVTQPG